MEGNDNLDDLLQELSLEEKKTSFNIKNHRGFFR